MRRAAGDVDEAHVDALAAASATDALEASGVAWSVAHASLALTLVDRGAPDEALRVLPSGVHPESESFFARDLARARATARLAAGDARGAMADLESVVRTAERDGPVADAWDWRTEAVEAHTATGDVEAARELADAELRWAQRIGVSWREGRALRSLAGLHHGDEQVVLLREAAEKLSASEWVLEHTRARLELGAALRRGGLRREAREHLRSALDASLRGGALAMAERARQELAASGARLRREQLTGVDSLTPAERRVVRDAAAGATNRQIAQALFLSTKTVESHLRSVFRKLDLTSRHQLAEVLPPSDAGVEPS